MAPPDGERRPRRRLRGAIELAAVAILILIALAFDRSPLVVVPVLFLLVVPFEKLFPRHKGQPIRRPQLATDIAYALASPALNAIAISVAVAVGIASLLWVPGLMLRPLVGLLPAVAVPLAGVLLFDLTTYWVHRWSHEVPILWRFHSVHHSTEHLDWISGFRAHPLDGALLAPPFIFLLAAGFAPELAGGLALIQVLLGIFLHANVRWRWRPLHRLVITPEFHHWHHTNDPRAIHSNYSVFLPLWDQVFGTYFMPRDRRPDRYGIDEHMPEGMVGQLRHPFRDAGNPLLAARHPILAARRTGRFIATLLGQIKRSTTRRRTIDPLPTISLGTAEIAAGSWRPPSTWRPPSGLHHR
jgi:sterol desaturase/sphingolipid hydroxylase (fatty acid hydroxylase superfamily)